MTRFQHLLAFLLITAISGGCESREPGGAIQVAAKCEPVNQVEGTYNCSGECVVTAPDGSRQLIVVSGEVDTIERFPGAKMGLYQVSVVNGDFRELEIGGLVGHTLRTATAEVSDGRFPVLEEDIFQIGPNCEAVAFTKIVRNPSKENFKSCSILCTKDVP